MAKSERAEGPGGSPTEGRQPTEIKVQLPPQLAGGAYANGMLVQHTSDEFVMDFTMVVGGNGTVVSRVVTSPTHMKRMIGALQENMRRFEVAHGPVAGREPEAQPKMRLGFHPPAE